MRQSFLRLQRETARLQRTVVRLEHGIRTHKQDIDRLLRDMIAVLGHSPEDVKAEGAPGDELQLPREIAMWEEARAGLREQMYHHSQDLQHLPYDQDAEEESQDSG